jgi:toxin ParE1/3/4
MAQLLRTPQANRDLLDIWTYVAKDSEAAADRLLQSIDKRCWLLAEHPQLGERVERYRPGLRRLTVGNYLVFYQLIEGGIEVFRVLHGARDIDQLF